MLVSGTFKLLLKATIILKKTLCNVLKQLYRYYLASPADADADAWRLCIGSTEANEFRGQDEISQTTSTCSRSETACPSLHLSEKTPAPWKHCCGPAASFLQEQSLTATRLVNSCCLCSAKYTLSFLDKPTPQTSRPGVLAWYNHIRPSKADWAYSSVYTKSTAFKNLTTVLIYSKTHDSLPHMQKSPAKISLSPIQGHIYTQMPLLPLIWGRVQG